MDVAIASDGIFSQATRSGIIPIRKSSTVSTPFEDGGFRSPMMTDLNPLFQLGWTRHIWHIFSYRCALHVSHSDPNQVLIPFTMTRAEPGEMILNDKHILNSQNSEGANK